MPIYAMDFEYPKCTLVVNSSSRQIASDWYNCGTGVIRKKIMVWAKPTDANSGGLASRCNKLVLQIEQVGSRPSGLSLSKILFLLKALTLSLIVE